VYDEAGNKTQQIDALGRVTRWEYDAMGRQLRRMLPGGQAESMAYDAAGQLVAKTDFNGRTTRYSYDAAGRLASVDYESDADVITTYTASGQRESVTDGQGTTLYSYDARDRLLRVVNPDGSVLRYDYDAAGNRVGLHSAALDQAFVFDALNRLSEVRSQTLGGAQRTVRYGYDDVGNRTTLEQANGVVTTTAFDGRNRLRQLATRTAAGVLLFGASYDLDLSGARTGIGEFDANGPTRSVGYAYDGAKRLIAEAITRPNQATRLTQYVYDAVGNRLSKSEAGVLTTYTVDANDRLTQHTQAGETTLYTYDANGNTTGQAKPGSWTRYDYDQANKLVRTSTSAGSVISTGYDADGIRNSESSNGHASSWLIDANRDYAQTLEAYTDGQLTTVWQYGDELLSQSSVINGGVHERNLHADGMGSVRQASDATDALTDSFEYDAFGNELARTGTTDIDHRYRGEQIDIDTGLYNLRARWYDPGAGRFVSMDTWSGVGDDPISLHRYLYASSDPIEFIDPSGEFSLSQMAVAGLVNASIGMVMDLLSPTQSVTWGGVAKDFAVGVALAPVGGLLSRAFAPILQSLSGPVLRTISALEPLMLRGKPAIEKFLIKLSRVLFNSTKGYPSVQSTLIGRTLKMLYPSLRWEQHHIFIQQSWTRIGGESQIFFDDLAMNEGLRRLGNGGWNLMPIPRALNNFLGRSQEYATPLFASFIYSVAVFGPMQTYQAVSESLE
jgi:RHS repeat-associated protein